VSIALAVLLWRAFLGADGLGAGGRAVVASGGVLATILAVLSLLTTMANIQGASAPFASLLPLLAVGASAGDLRETLDQVRPLLAGSPGAGRPSPPALEVMIGDFARYHAVMAVVAAVVALALLGLTLTWWRRFARARTADRRRGFVVGSLGVLSGVMSLIVIVLAMANATTAADPAPALLAFFDGGW
jgi:hypothetical protein